MGMEKRITTPLSEETVKELRAGDKVLISGYIYTARDAAHKRMVEVIERGESLPMDLKGMIGKGYRSERVKELLKEYRAVYFAAIGGVAVLLQRYIKSSELIAWEDLGTEAVRRLYVEDFPVVVANDAFGGDLFEEGRRKYAQV